MNTTLVRATEIDTDEIYQLAKRIWTHHYVPIIGQDQVSYMLDKMYSKEALIAQMSEKSHHIYFIKTKETIGFISVSGHDPMFLHKFYIDQDRQRHGIGTQVFEELLKIYPEVNTISLTVNRENFKSINFYFKLGFVIDRVEDFDIGSGYLMNDFVMRWDLNKKATSI